MAQLDLLLTPNRSLDRRHMSWLVGGVALIFLVGGLRFLVLGAWPVLPFMAADVALLWWAFRASYASGRGHERLVLADGDLMLTRVSAWGEVQRFAFEAYWTRVDMSEDALGDAIVCLASRGRRVRLGSFLSSPERLAVGKVVAAALSDYRARPSTSAIA
jgi:uncharacterized membrane protein